MTHRWIITALGKDRPGIVAGVTKVLYTRGCNLEDSAMTRLEGEFAIMLIFSASSSMNGVALRRAFAPLERRFGLVVHLKGLTPVESRPPRPRGRRCVISVYGADRPGIVFRISAALARARINITDVHTHLSAVPSGTGQAGRSAPARRRRGPSLYLLLLEVELPPGRTLPSLERQLKGTATRLGVELSVHPGEPNVL